MGSQDHKFTIVGEIVSLSYFHSFMHRGSIICGDAYIYFEPSATPGFSKILSSLREVMEVSFIF